MCFETSGWGCFFPALWHFWHKSKSPQWRQMNHCGVIGRARQRLHRTWRCDTAEWESVLGSIIILPTMAIEPGESIPRKLLINAFSGGWIWSLGCGKGVSNTRRVKGPFSITRLSAVLNQSNREVPATGGCNSISTYVWTWSSICLPDYSPQSPWPPSGLAATQSRRCNYWPLGNMADRVDSASKSFQDARKFPFSSLETRAQSTTAQVSPQKTKASRTRG